jgi:hypothetical protein
MVKEIAHPKFHDELLNFCEKPPGAAAPDPNGILGYGSRQFLPLMAMLPLPPRATSPALGCVMLRLARTRLYFQISNSGN